MVTKEDAVATPVQGGACTALLARLPSANEKLRLLVAALMLPLFVLNAPSPSGQSGSASVAPQTAGSIAAHLPGPTKVSTFSKA